ncbi:MAG TPA: cobyrinate a,c-diamide synthase [Candidatus Baltobacteraceae bacterium]|nr:cobyrinate a,c-diamide synthase [Candidatus Baltobacteraceae bacterium]
MLLQTQPPRQPLPRLVLAAASSDSGKTTITLGLIAALRRRGLKIAASKVGPDFIDAAHLARVSGRPARNLDAWLAPETVVISSFLRGSLEADLAIVEGVMGLFDGRHGSGEASTAHLARILRAPVILVLDCAKASSTIGAIALGLARYDERVRVAGAILNRVASERHASTVRDACRKAGVPVFGVIRRDERLALPSRHLGLVSPDGETWSSVCEAAADIVEAEVDLDALIAVAQDVPEILAAPFASAPEADVRIAIARDEAFWFYDEASLDALRDAGAELVPYAPLHDPFPSDVHAVFIGGGYPESYAATLETNVSAKDGLHRAIRAGMPAYAECGGLMYLGRTLETSDRVYSMADVVPATSIMSQRRSALRYVEARVLEDGPLFVKDQIVRGHEFHYSRTSHEHAMPAFELDGEHEGYRSSDVHASYVHVHLSAHPTAVRTFVSRARAFAGRRTA